jgi:RHS repeat-associated protein
LNPPSQSTYTYVPNSSLIATITSPAHTVSNVYEDTRNVLESKVNKKLDTTTVSSYFYNVNNIGQRTSVDTSGTAFAAGQRDRAWSYDSFGQLITESDSNNTAYNRAYQYDSIGNRLQGSAGVSPASVTNYTPNVLNQYSSITNPQSTIFNPTHDSDGNTVETQIRQSGLGTTALTRATFVWDGENRLIEVKNTTGTTIAKYAYDAYSRRIHREVTGGVNIAYLYNGWNPIAEYSLSSLPAPSSTLTKSYTWGLDLSGNSIQGAGGVGGLLLITDHLALGTPSYYPLFDGNGNVSEYLDSNGNIAAHYEYDAFGNVVNFTESTSGLASTFCHRFSNKQQDDETGLLYYGYRYYDPITGRWPSRDPIGERGGMNLYGFVGNDGVNWVDLLGLSEFSYSECICKFAAGAADAGLDTLKGMDPREMYNSIKSIATAISRGEVDLSDAINALGADFKGFYYHFTRGNYDHACWHAGRATFEIGLTVLGGGAGIKVLTSLKKLKKLKTLKKIDGPGDGKPFVPDEYWTRNAPDNVTPGTKRLDHTKYNETTGDYEHSRVTYDEYGRQQYRVDKSDHGRPLGGEHPNDKGHSNPHLHERTYHPKGTQWAKEINKPWYSGSKEHWPDTGAINQKYNFF